MDSKSQSLVPVREVSVKISDDDYFIRNPELSVWLRDEKNIFFSDIDTATAKVHFSEFVRLWNAGRLPDKYYIGTAANTVQRTGYAWSFKGNLCVWMEMSTWSCNCNLLPTYIAGMPPWEGELSMGMAPDDIVDPLVQEPRIHT